MGIKGITIVDLLLKANLLFICFILFFPSPLTCSDFALHYKEYFALSLFLVFTFWLVLLRNKGKVISLNRIDLLVLVFSLYMLVDFRCFSIEYFSKIIVALLTFSAFRNVSIRFIYVCIVLIIFSSLVQALYCWLGFVYPWDSLNDIEGIFHNTGIWGGFVALCSIFVCGAGLFLVKRYKIVLLLLLMLLVYLVYESSSRAAWIAILISLLYFFYVKYEKNAICKVGLFFGVFLFVIVCFPKMYHLKAESAIGRIYIWKNSLSIIKEHLFLGTGQGGFQVHYMKEQALHLQKNTMSQFAQIASETDNPFNEFIKLTVEYGILGLALFVILLYYVFHQNANKIIGTILLKGVLVGILVFAFFSYPFMYIQFQLLFVMCLAGISHESADNMVEIKKLIHIRWIMVLFFFLIFPILKYYYYSLQWEYCVNQAKYTEEEKIEKMGALYPVLNTNAAFLTYYAYLYSKKEDYANSVSKWKESLTYKVSYKQYISLGQDLERMGKYDTAESYWETASYMIPSRFTPIYLQIEMAMKIKEYKKADSLITLFMAKDKKVDSPDLERMNENVLKWRNQLHCNW